MEDREAVTEGEESYFAKCYGVLPLCLKTDATPHFHCPMSVKCSFVSFDDTSVKAHIEQCSTKPATIPEESYLICSKVQAFCVAGQDNVKKSSGQKHYHCAGYPECMYVNSRLNALKGHIFTCEKLAKRLDLYPVCTELACRHQYDETKFHFHCENCEWTTEDINDIEQHRVNCFVLEQATDEVAETADSDVQSLPEQDPDYGFIVALVSNEDDSVVINLETCSKKQCMKKIDINKAVQEHYHCPACEFCAVEREEIMDHFNHIHCNAATTEIFIPECYALEFSCCAEKRVEKNKTIMAPVLHYHCPQCKEYSDCSLNIVKEHYAHCDFGDNSGGLQQKKKRQKLNLVQLFNPQEEVVTEVVNPSPQKNTPLAAKKVPVPENHDPFNHKVIECMQMWKGCSLNRGVSLQHFHCPYCTWSSSLLVNIQAHMPGCLEKVSSRFPTISAALQEEDGEDCDSLVEYPIIDFNSKEYINIIPCFRQGEGCSRTFGSSRIHWHCPICTISGSKAAMAKHFAACSVSLDDGSKDHELHVRTRKEMHPDAMRHTDSEDSDIEFLKSFDTAESLTNVIRCYKKLSICSVDDFPGRPVHYHCGICGKPDLNRIQLECHQVYSCLASRAKALRDDRDPNEEKYKNPPTVISCRHREASCIVSDSKRITHFHCSVCTYVSYRKDRAEKHVEKAHLSKSLFSESSPTSKCPAIFRPTISNLSGISADDPINDFMERCEEDIRNCKMNRKVDHRRRGHWHCTGCDFVDYKRYRIRCHVLKNHIDEIDDSVIQQKLNVTQEPDDSIDVIDQLSSDDEEDDIHGIFSCVNVSGSCSKSKKKGHMKKHWHCSMCNFTAATRNKAFPHYVKCLKKGKKIAQNQHIINAKSQQFLNRRSDKDDVNMFEVPNCTTLNNSPLIYCSQSVYQCVFPLNTRIDDHGQQQHWHCPMCDKVGFIEYEGLKHYVHCSNFIEFHVKSQMPNAVIDIDIMQCTKEYLDCAPNRKVEDRKPSHFHCPLCPYVDFRKTKVSTHYNDLCSGKASSTHIMYCSGEIDKCSSGAQEAKPGYFGHWHCSLCTFTDYNQRKVASHYRECYAVNPKYGSRYGIDKEDDDVPLLQDMPDDPVIKYPDLQSLDDKELTLLKIIPCNRRLDSCEIPGRDLDEQPLHYHCPICTKSDYLQLMLRHFPRCLRYLEKKRKAAAMKADKLPTKKKQKVTKADMKKARNEGLGCQLVDKIQGIFVVRGSAVGLGFPVHVIFKKTHPKEFHCESGCEMQDRQLCKHLAAVERFVREHNIFKEDDDCESVDLNEDFPDLDQIDLFHRISDEEKCDVYTLHNHCLINNTPVIRAFQTFKYPDGEETACTFYSVCNAMFKGYYTRSGRVITTYNKKTQKYLCKCFYKECVHTTVTKLYRASQGLSDCYGAQNTGSITIGNKNGIKASDFMENFYDHPDQQRFLKNLSTYD